MTILFIFLITLAVFCSAWLIWHCTHCRRCKYNLVMHPEKCDRCCFNLFKENSGEICNFERKDER